LGTPAPLLAPLDEADVVLVLGSRLSEITTQAYTRPRTGSRVIQVDLDAASLGSVVPVERAVVATVASFVADLLAYGTPARSSAVWAQAHARYLRFSDPGEQNSAGGVHPAQVIAAMRRHVPADAVITNDAGNFSVFGHRYWRFGHPRTQLGPTSGAMGYAVPAAIGAGLAAPERSVVALAGDGGFLMTGQEIETAVRYGVSVLTVIFQNGMHGTIALHQARATGRLAGVDIGPVDLAGFARSLGAEAVTVTDAADLDDAFAAVTGRAGPRVLVVRTDPDVLTPSARLSGLLTGEVDR
jgi:acetolactate synthase-1/2/3 large subunit